MCLPKAPSPPPPMAERQATQLPDQGSTADTIDEIARRRRQMLAATATGAGMTLGNPSTTAPSSSLGA